MCMYRGAGGYWRTYSYIYYVFLHGCLSVLENMIQLYIMYRCMYKGAGGYWRTYSNKYILIRCTCVMECTGEHTDIYISCTMYMCIYRGARGY